MKKLLSFLLTAAMLVSCFAMSVGADSDVGTAASGSGSASRAIVMPTLGVFELNDSHVDVQGVYYTLNDDTMTAIVGKNTYSDSASAATIDIAVDIVIPEAVSLGDKTYAVTAVGRNAFDGAPVKSAVILCDEIGEFAFAGCTELSYVYTTATKISGFAFWGCTALNEAHIYYAETIGGGAFWGCDGINTVTLLSAKTIMAKAFEGCDGLRDIVIVSETAAPQVAADAIPAGIRVCVLKDTEELFADFPIDVTALEKPYISVNDVYGEAGQTVLVPILAPAGFYTDNLTFTIEAAEGLTVTGVLDSKSVFCNLTDVLFADGAMTGKVGDNEVLTLAYLVVKLDDGIAAGRYNIKVADERFDSVEGAVIVCAHDNTETRIHVAANCTEGGIADTVCADCHKVIEGGVEIPAKDHTYRDFVIAPTCEEGGYTRHICSHCVHAYSDAETEALGHDWDEGVVKVEASTSKKGLIVYTCKTCAAQKEVETPKLCKHSWDDGVVTKKPTTTEEGVLTYTCSKCNETKEEPIPVLLVKPGDVNSDGEVNLADVTLLLKHLASWDVTVSEAADVNGDEAVNLADVTLLLKYLAGWDVALG